MECMSVFRVVSNEVVSVFRLLSIDVSVFRLVMNEVMSVLRLVSMEVGHCVGWAVLEPGLRWVSLSVSRGVKGNPSVAVMSLLPAAVNSMSGLRI